MVQYVLLADITYFICIYIYRKRDHPREEFFPAEEDVIDHKQVPVSESASPPPPCNSKQQHQETVGPRVKSKGKCKKKSKSGGGTAEEIRTMSSSASDLKCSVCSKQYHSRNKLFQHIKDSGHAVMRTPSLATSKKTGKGRRSKGTQ